MAGKKTTAKKSTTEKKPATRKPRAKKAAPKKEPEAIAEKAEDTADDIGRINLYGEIFWEYRAKMAEYEKALLEFKVKDEGLRKEKLDPKYAKLLSLIQEQAQLSEELKRYANLLRGVQVKVASKLNLDIETFLKGCTIDHETGVVTIFD